MEQREQRTSPAADSDTALIRILALVVCVLIPLQILAYGYFPQDDALRHAAKAVSGRAWEDILLHRPGVLDFSPGWHAILTGVHRITGAGAAALVQIEIVSLFVLFSLGPVLLMRRAEAWLAALALVALVETQLVFRLVLGRPFILSAAVAMTILLVWPRLDTERLSKPVFAVVSLLIAAAAWIHGSWYLFALPVIAFIIAGRLRVAARLMAATAVGVLLGALLTGHPFAFLWQNFQLALNIGGGGVSAGVFELKPYPGAPLLAIVTAVLVVMRKVWRGEPVQSLAKDPAFILAALGWLLGLRSARFWMDWGTPAILVFIALEIEALWMTLGSPRRRLAHASLAALVCFLVWTGNVNDRWNAPTQLPFKDMLAPERAGTLPDSGGILYTDDKRAFYDLFFLRPNAPWKYSTGYAPELMPPEDYAIYNERLARGIEALEPWVRRMRPEDRMLLRDDRGIPPWRWLQWQALGGGYWSGRLPR